MESQRIYTRHHVGLIVALIGLMSGATLMLSPARVASAQAVAAKWSNTGNLNTARSGYTTTPLSNGKVLVAGGFHCSSQGCFALNSAELYDPATGTWTPTGGLNFTGDSYAATLLTNGKVLIVKFYSCGVTL